MKPEQQWLDIKESYLKQVEKNLSTIEHPRRAEILSDVSQHLESKYSELPDDQRNWEGYQHIIIEMGPPEEYAELLSPEPTAAKTKFGINELLAAVFVLTLICIGAYLVYTAKKNPPVSPQSPQSFTFESDERVLGKWVTVDFVNTIDQFNPAKKYWSEELFLLSLDFSIDGKVRWEAEDRDPMILDWTKGKVEPRSERPSFYYLQTIDGQLYMFFEWVSGDVTDRGRQPAYYVLKKKD